MATLIQRGKKWYVVYYDHTGKKRWVKGYTDKRETQALANRLEDEKTKHQRGEIDPKNAQRKIERAKDISAHLSEYKLALQAKGNSSDHVRQVNADIQQFIDYAKANSGLTHADAITRAMVDQWVMTLREKTDGDANRTINRRVGAVKSFLKKLHSIGTISEYVLYKYPKLPVKGFEKRLPRVLEVAEQAKLLLSAPAERVEIYRFCLGTGARHSACVALEVNHVNFKEKTVSLKRKDNTHTNNLYVVPIHSDLLPILERLCAGKTRSEKLFHVPVRSMASRLLRTDCKTAGVDTSKVMFHGLRHSFITTLARSNIHPNVVQALAGHKNITTTLEYYTHFKRTDERSALEVLKL